MTNERTEGQTKEAEGKEQEQAVTEIEIQAS